MSSEAGLVWTTRKARIGARTTASTSRQVTLIYGALAHAESTFLVWLDACRVMRARAALFGRQTGPPRSSHRRMALVLRISEAVSEIHKAGTESKPGISLSACTPVTPVRPAENLHCRASTCHCISKSRRGREASQAWHARRSRGPQPLQSFLARRCQMLSTGATMSPPA